MEEGEGCFSAMTSCTVRLELPSGRVASSDMTLPLLSSVSSQRGDLILPNIMS